MISEFEGDHTKTYNNLKNSILVHRKHNVGLRGALVGSVANKMFAPEFIKDLSVLIALTNGADVEFKKRADNIILFMKQYSKVRPHMRSLDKLTNKSQKEITKTCDWIGNNFTRMFPERIISPTLHMLIVHVPQFAQKYNNLGLYSESAFESVHGEVNKSEQVFANVTDRESRCDVYSLGLSSSDRRDLAGNHPRNEYVRDATNLLRKNPSQTASASENLAKIAQKSGKSVVPAKKLRTPIWNRS